MVFLRSVSVVDSGPVVRGEGVILRIPVMSDFDAWACLRDESRAFLAPWEPTWPLDDLTRPAFRRRLRRYWRDVREDSAYPFFVFDDRHNELLGGLTLGNIRRGVAQSCQIGYWIGERHRRQGHMTRAVRQAVRFAFDELKLHRMEAACLPDNLASIGLLRRCGFVEEGRARRYLRINGEWRDHLLFATLSDDGMY